METRRIASPWRVLMVSVAALGLGLVLVASADAYIYWSNGDPNTIGRASLNGSGANQRFIAGAGAVTGVAVDSSYIYWTNTSFAGLGTTAIGRANLDGSNVNQTFIAGPVGPLAGVAVDRAHIYWASYGTNNKIGRANLDGSGVNESFITGASDPRGVAVNGRHIYWANRTSKTIGRANLDGSAVNHSFIASARDPRGVALDRRNVYWTHGPGKIGRANLDGSGVNQNFIGAANSPAGVAVDRAHIYWASPALGGASGKIGRDDLEGSDADMSFISGGSPVYVAVDALPSNAFSFGRKRALADGSARLELQVPGAGAIRGQQRKARRRTAMIKSLRARAAGAGTVALTLRPTSAAKQLLRRGRAVSASVRVTFTPSGGVPASKTTQITLRKKKKKKKKSGSLAASRDAEQGLETRERNRRLVISR